MAKSIPVDVIRQMQNHVTGLKNSILTLRQDAYPATIKADVLRTEKTILESMLDNWMSLFPEKDEARPK